MILDRTLEDTQPLCTLSPGAAKFREALKSSR
jgi:hypothetical protein